MNIYMTPPEEVDAMWPLVKGWIARACRRTGDIENPDNLRELCKAGRHNLTALYDDNDRLTGVVVFEHCGKFLHITSCGGHDIIANLPGWVDVWRQIARVVGCEGVSLRGRRGWDRALAPFGFTRNNEFLEAQSWA